MERAVSLFYNGALAHYGVYRLEDGSYRARLNKYAGSPEQAPPVQFDLHQEGRYWRDGAADEELIHELGKAIEMLRSAVDWPTAPEPRPGKQSGSPETDASR